MKKYLSKIIGLILFFVIYNNVYAINLSTYSITLTPGESDKIEVYGGYHDNIINSIYAMDGVNVSFTPYYAFTTDDENEYIFSLDENENNVALGVLNVTAIQNTLVNSASVKIGNAYLKVLVNQQDNIEDLPVEHLLKEIKSSFVDITLKENTFEYTVNISEDLTKLDLKPVAVNEKTKIDISTQIIENMEDNKIIITATLDDVTQEYIINVVKKEKEAKVISYEKKEYHYNKIWNIILGVSITFFVIGISLVLIKKGRKNKWKKSI